MPAPLRHHAGTVLAPRWHRAGTAPVSYWHRTGTIAGPRRHRSGTSFIFMPLPGEYVVKNRLGREIGRFPGKSADLPNTGKSGL